MNIVILGGFLGSGKTSVLLQLADYVSRITDSAMPLAIIENEVGAIGIDDQVAQRGYEVTSMLSGCACCTLKADLAIAARDIERDLKPSMLVIEATGMAVPMALRETLEAACGTRAFACTLVDASRWKRYHVPMERLFARQLEDADLIVVNKTDLVDEGELDELRGELDAFNDEAPRIFACAQQPLADETLAAIAGLSANDTDHGTR